MSRFYGTLTGQARTSATRRGSTTSGLTSHTRGWNVGVKVECRDCSGDDEITIRTTGGSNKPTDGIPLGTIKTSPTGARYFVPSAYIRTLIEEGERIYC